jgi:predicted dehydrogenase
VYRELEAAGRGVALAAAVEPNSARAAEAEAKYAIPVFASVDELLAAGLKLDAASVAVPTVHHHAVAAPLLEAGVDLLVEKPLAASLDEADDLIRIAEKSDGAGSEHTENRRAKGKRVLQPGHLERFNPAVLAIEPKLRRPMFFEAHRLSIFTPRSLDVDVVLDLMIHDLDIVLAFAHSPVREVRAVGLPILSPKVDIANVRVEFESGCVANFTASRVSTERVRKLRFFEPRQYVSIDYARQDLLVIRLDAAVASGVAASVSATPGIGAVAAGLTAAELAELAASGAVPGLTPEMAEAFAAGKIDPSALAKLAGAFGATPNPGLNFAKLPVTPGEPLRLEIESFLDSVRTRREPRVTARQGRAALALALEIKASMAAHAVRAGLEDFFAPGG